MALAHFTVNDSQAEILAVIDRDGACILDALLEPSACDQLMADFMPHIEAAEWTNASKGDSDPAFFGYKTKRFHGLAGLSAHSEMIITHPLLLSLASDFVGRGEHCRALRVSTMELMVLGEGQANQTLHRDGDSWAYLPRQAKKRLLFSANIALSDFTATNGATVVVPGSHHWPDDRTATPEECCLAIMNKGSALLYSGDVVHGGGNNTEPNLRTGFYIGYIPSWLSPLENHAVSSGLHAINGFNERTRHLLNVVEDGFSVIP